MPIIVRCSCGKELHARDDMAGKSGKCPGCGEILVFEVHHTGQTRVIARKNNPFDFPGPAARKAEPSVIKVTEAAPPPNRPMFERPDRPAPSPMAAAPLPDLTAVPKPPPPIFKPQKKKEQNVLLELRHLILGVALIPLAMSLFQPQDNVNERRIQTEEHLSADAKRRVESLMNSNDATLDDYFDVLPENKLEGAYLPKRTLTHWGYAVVSALIFLCIIVFLFPKGDAAASELFLAGAFTGMVGILLLLGVQWIAFHSGGRVYGGKAIVIFIILQFIAFSYRAALDPEYGFLSSLFGFTFGVGLLEELTKALPVFWRSDKLGWREACVWGLASGVGFGVSEGVSYASSFYNGITGGDIYLIRFSSCVALHAVWSAAVGIAIFRSKANMATEKSHPVIEGLKVLIIPMFLHGLYDTFLKKDMPGAAFLTALFSFGWLAFQIERALVEEERAENAVPAPATI